MKHPEFETRPMPKMLPASPQVECRVLNGEFLLFRRLDSRGIRLQSHPGPGAPGIDVAWPILEMVLDGSNLLPFHFLRAGDQLGRAVLKIQRDDGSTGTGFLVAPDVLMTNHHVLPDVEAAEAAVALANYEISPPGDLTGRPAARPLDPKAMFVTNPDLDFTFCGVQGLEFLGTIPLDRERMHIAIDETVTIIQHPRGRPKEVALRDNRVVQADNVVVQYACDTEPGSSGSPVFNDQWRPVAIHHASVLTDSPEGRRIAGDSSGRYLNEGIRLSAIALWLETAEANTPRTSEYAARLRALFGGLNPRAGFFGALGRRSHGRSASEVVADSYQPHSEVLDLGFWDTRIYTAGGLRPHATDLGRVIADMKLDAWCLSHADPAGLDALCEKLWAAHGLSYHPVSIAGPAGPAGAGPGVLLRRSTMVTAEPIVEGPSGLPPRVRLRASVRRGLAEVMVVPATRGPRDAPALKALARALLRGEPEAVGADWLLLGDFGLVAEAEAAGLFEAVDTAVCTADQADGAAIFLPGEGSLARQVFATPNLKVGRDIAGLLSRAQDRALPESLRPLAGPGPLGLRLALDADDPAPPPAVVSVPPIPPQIGLPRSREALDALIEQKLRDLLTPVVAKILAQPRDAQE